MDRNTMIVAVVAIIAVAVVALLIIMQGPSAPEPQPTPESYCGDMSLTEAKQIALASECGDQGSLKDTYMCNEDTSTWWIDLDIQTEGCNPACVINVNTEEAEINWRCTGLLPPPPPAP